MSNELISESERLQMEQIRDLESEILQVEEVDESSDDEELRCLSIYRNLVKFLYMRFDFALFFFFFPHLFLAIYC